MKIGINLNFFYVVKFDGFDAQTQLIACRCIVTKTEDTAYGSM